MKPFIIDQYSNFTNPHMRALESFWRSGDESETLETPMLFIEFLEHQKLWGTKPPQSKLLPVTRFRRTYTEYLAPLAKYSKFLSYLLREYFQYFGHTTGTGTEADFLIVPEAEKVKICLCFLADYVTPGESYSDFYREPVEKSEERLAYLPSQSSDNWCLLDYCIALMLVEILGPSAITGFVPRVNSMVPYRQALEQHYKSIGLFCNVFAGACSTELVERSL